MQGGEVGQPHQRARLFRRHLHIDLDLHALNRLWAGGL
jgi:hypothetical protein